MSRKGCAFVLSYRFYNWKDLKFLQRDKFKIGIFSFPISGEKIYSAKGPFSVIVLL